jgi:tetratricopeptide (TPR) repeat protein
MFLLLSAPSVFAERLELAGGGSIEGEVITIGDQHIEIELASGGRTKIAFSRLVPNDAYRLRLRQTPPTSGADHRELAGWCRRTGLGERAEQHLRQALALDPTAAIARELEELQEQLAGETYRRAVLLVGERKLSAAQELARLVLDRWPNTIAAGWSGELVDAIDTAIAAEQQARLQTATATATQERLAVELKREKLRQQLRKQIDERLQAAQALYAEALLAEGNDRTSPAMDAFDRCHTTFESAFTASQQLRPMLGGNKQLVVELRTLQQQLVSRWIAALLAAVHLRLRQGNWRDAERWIDRALLLEPLNGDALKLRELVGTQRIRFKMSEVTNIKPIIKN